MKTIVLNQFGDVENLQIKELPIPSISEDEVLIKVKAISINPVDIKTRKGEALANKLKKHDPLVLGWDISGTIEKTGHQVTDFSVGEDVFGMVNFVGHGKAYAEYVAVPASQIARKPSNISHEEAAASTLAALTAWQAFTEFGHLKAGDKVLIHAASGGVGHFAVQIAKYLKAYVIGTSSAQNKEFVLGLGADEHVDYRKQRFEDVLSEIDFCLESIGGENFERTVEVVRPFGTIINLPSGLSETAKEKSKRKNIKACFFMAVYSNGKDMNVIAHLLEKGIIKAHVSNSFAFEEMAEAHRQIESGRTVGKVVISV
ncbi:NADP-dependent oxidoreductase [Rapidithrix thailandica]|uniref:NADP-dependent oxidoreductase n=1 Tax=Rapidithrix thailandica TaxID=413964 RepID=A0AAW9S1U1_9BACT